MLLYIVSMGPEGPGVLHKKNLNWPKLEKTSKMTTYVARNGKVGAIIMGRRKIQLPK